MHSVEAVICFKYLHTVIKCIGDAFVVGIHRLLLGIVCRKRKLLQHRLPGIGLLAVFVKIVMSVENSCISQILKIAPYLVIAGIQIVSVVV